MNKRDRSEALSPSNPNDIYKTPNSKMSQFKGNSSRGLFGGGADDTMGASGGSEAPAWALELTSRVNTFCDETKVWRDETVNKFVEIDKSSKIMSDDMKSIRKEQYSMKQETRSIKKMMIESDYRARERNIIIKGVPLHPQADRGIKESQAQTHEVLQEYLSPLCHAKEGLDAMQAAVRYSTKESMIKELRQKNKKIAPLIKITLYTIEAKQKMYRQLAEQVKANPRHPLLSKLTFQTDYPAALLNDLNTLEGEAYRIRLATNKSVKTRVEYSQGALVLMTKQPAEAHYKVQKANKDNTKKINK